MSELPAPEPAGEEPPPVLGTWRRLYAFVLIELALITLGAYLFGRWAS